MRHIKKLTILLILILNSCSNNDDSESELTGPIRLKSVVITSTDMNNSVNVRTRNFFYNTDGKLDKIETIDNSQNISYINYNYSNGKLTSLTRTDGSFIETYSYTNELITSSDTYNSSGNIAFTKVYEYDSNGRVTQSDTGVGSPILFTYSGNNVITIGSEFGTTFYYEYDTKENPDKTVYPIELQKIDLIGSNNVITISNSSSSSTSNTTYNYNSLNYPTTSNTNNGSVVVDYEYEEY
ncbi:hypothetical protein GCM10022271_22870 [Corallibacter vietnamensis]|uniref:YD repeat-containing protein n=1 Tax=Corallibacter vietnamensis TaxID=904130 RepID=A0ABP7HAY6_9FLAO